MSPRDDRLNKLEYSNVWYDTIKNYIIFYNNIIYIKLYFKEVLHKWLIFWQRIVVSIYIFCIVKELDSTFYMFYYIDFSSYHYSESSFGWSLMIYFILQFDETFLKITKSMKKCQLNLSIISSHFPMGIKRIIKRIWNEFRIYCNQMQLKNAKEIGKFAKEIVLYMICNSFIQRNKDV